MDWVFASIIYRRTLAREVDLSESPGPRITIILSLLKCNGPTHSEIFSSFVVSDQGLLGPPTCVRKWTRDLPLALRGPSA